MNRNIFKVSIDNSITGKIQLIKAIRSILGLGLKESKDFVEEHLQVATDGGPSGYVFKSHFTLILTAEQLGMAYFYIVDQNNSNCYDFYMSKVERFVPVIIDFIDCTTL